MWCLRSLYFILVGFALEIYCLLHHRKQLISLPIPFSYVTHKIASRAGVQGKYKLKASIAGSLKDCNCFIPLFSSSSFSLFFSYAICSDSCRDCNRKWGKNIRKPVYRELFVYSEAPEISWEPWHTSLFQPSFTNWRVLSTFQINIHISMYYYSYLFMLWQDKEIPQD